MSRVTVEDCLKFIPDRFELTNIAAKRALQIHNGAEPLVNPDGDKPVVIALREIAEGLVSRKEAVKQAKARYASYNERFTDPNHRMYQNEWYRKTKVSPALDKYTAAQNELELYNSHIKSSTIIC